MSHRRKRFLGMASLTATMGLLAFSGVASNPRFETIHTLDILRLMIAGAAVAVTIFALIQFFNLGPCSADIRAEEKSREGSG